MSINQLTYKWAHKQNVKGIYFPEISSTNDVAKLEFAKTKSSKAIYLADHQTQGRGRNKNTWQNLNAGEILLSTWCFKTNKSPQPIFTPLIGLGLYRALKTLQADMPLRLKPPNDIFLNGAKLAGLLVEVSQQGQDVFVYIGLGLNVYSAPQVDNPTAHLEQALPITQTNWFSFCNQLMLEFSDALIHGQNSKLSTDHQLELLNAINSGLPKDQQYKAVSPYCDLEAINGVISWMDL